MVGARGVFPATAVTRNNAPGDERLRPRVSFFRPSRGAPLLRQRAVRIRVVLHRMR
ncbi:hypothetical protein SGPA1_20150 [Streptomyces misionensis JCM 4497]